MTRRPDITDAAGLLEAALERRAPLAVRSDLTAYRLLNGAAEGAPRLAVDRYGDVAVVHADSYDVLARWHDVLRDVVRLPTAYAKVHPAQASRLTTEERSALAPEQPLWGAPRESVEVVEHGARYVIRPAAGLSVGLFLDMRDVRDWLHRNSAGKRVLNLFGYTCAFGVRGVLGGAARVLNIDISRSNLDWGRENYQLNGLATDQHDFVYGEAMNWLSRLARRDEVFDLVVLDPPSFSTTRHMAFSVQKDYVRLATLGARVVAPAGILLAATNHAGTSDERFDAWLVAALAAAGRSGRVRARWHEPDLDFPVPRGQRPYLKVRAIQLT